jgi:hypothetical protein
VRCTTDHGSYRISGGVGKSYCVKKSGCSLLMKPWTFVSWLRNLLHLNADGHIRSTKLLRRREREYLQAAEVYIVEVLDPADEGVTEITKQRTSSKIRAAASNISRFLGHPRTWWCTLGVSFSNKLRIREVAGYPYLWRHLNPESTNRGRNSRLIQNLCFARSVFEEWGRAMMLQD